MNDTVQYNLLNYELPTELHSHTLEMHLLKVQL